MKPFLLVFPGMERLAAALAAELDAERAPVALHRFPDGETLVALPPDLDGRDAALLVGLRDPDRQALALRFAAVTARELGARRVGLIAPYMAYMRQDARFAPGQAVSAPIFARFLEEGVDWLTTLDPHLHRIPSLDALFSIPARRAVAAPAIARWVAANVPDAALLGPDGESGQWVREAARLAGLPFEVLTKRRSGDFEVTLSAPSARLARTHTPVVVDDIASSGRTMARAVALLREAGARAPVCVVTHAIFAGDALEVIMAAGAARVVSTTSLPHPTNAIEIAPQLAAETRALGWGAAPEG
ncbi:ribose-phosphate diphosphokinase [Oceanicella actignis]|uniref:ribose-phosphate diphosphokinase n=1 Tax=Oceanicella actignis TaxID=1189325 RepID=UPI0011E61EFC|nr:ribose-phosphate diphosphokinase [Oceanicella actignis]TYO91175.1 ribose-phosphate pyrophosphokinase [Oceanicella actignis]